MALLAVFQPFVFIAGLLALGIVGIVGPTYAALAYTTLAIAAAPLCGYLVGHLFSSFVNLKAGLSSMRLIAAALFAVCYFGSASFLRHLMPFVAGGVAAKSASFVALISAICGTGFAIAGAFLICVALNELLLRWLCVHSSQRVLVAYPAVRFYAIALLGSAGCYLVADYLTTYLLP